MPDAPRNPTLIPEQPPCSGPLDRARRLRRDMTPAERLLWAALRDRRNIGLKFRRQVPMGPFILDFFDAEHKLALEVDGPVHEDRVEYDFARDSELRRRGLTILRFSNEEVLGDVDAVARGVAAYVQRLEAELGGRR
ncbi:endonuclease domain-containing protein [Paludisphaera rhizosphaerae]|uniref:endonuclease domain-containing protein n=1 Tax=Paludisphaera rhizosphaerae TaxID=2711216 RepID=UPI0013ED509A|nr:endonuclease domain-containing protein [Paludisphaera rhizosphaerae]